MVVKKLENYSEAQILEEFCTRSSVWTIGITRVIIVHAGAGKYRAIDIGGDSGNRWVDDAVESSNSISLHKIQNHLFRYGKKISALGQFRNLYEKMKPCRPVEFDGAVTGSMWQVTQAGLVTEVMIARVDCDHYQGFCLDSGNGWCYEVMNTYPGEKGIMEYLNGRCDRVITPLGRFKDVYQKIA